MLQIQLSIKVLNFYLGKKIGSDLVNKAQNAAKGIGNLAGQFGNRIQNGPNKIGNRIGNAARDAGNGIHNFFKGKSNDQGAPKNNTNISNKPNIPGKNGQPNQGKIKKGKFPDLSKYEVVVIKKSKFDSMANDLTTRNKSN